MYQTPRNKCYYTAQRARCPCVLDNGNNVIKSGFGKFSTCAKLYKNGLAQLSAH